MIRIQTVYILGHYQNGLKNDSKTDSRTASVSLLGVQYVAVVASTLDVDPKPPAAKADIFKESSPLLSVRVVALSLSHDEDQHAQHHVGRYGCHK